jgi:hypothetical protein
MNIYHVDNAMEMKTVSWGGSKEKRVPRIRLKTGWLLVDVERSGDVITITPGDSRTGNDWVNFPHEITDDEIKSKWWVHRSHDKIVLRKAI